MAILCLATDLKDLKEKLSNIIVGYTKDDIHFSDESRRTYVVKFNTNTFKALHSHLWWNWQTR